VATSETTDMRKSLRSPSNEVGDDGPPAMTERTGTGCLLAPERASVADVEPIDRRKRRLRFDRDDDDDDDGDKEAVTDGTELADGLHLGSRLPTPESAGSKSVVMLDFAEDLDDDDDGDGGACCFLPTMRLALKSVSELVLRKPFVVEPLAPPLASGEAADAAAASAASNRKSDVRLLRT
jgi:hypothetical protein